MAIEGSTYTFLSNITAITDIVGDRIYPHHLDLDTYPALTYNIVSITHPSVITGSAGIAVARIDFNCWSYSLDDCINVIEAIRLNLQSYQGSYGDETVIGSHLNDEMDLSEKPEDGSNAWLFRKTGDYSIKYRVPIPNV